MGRGARFFSFCAANQVNKVRARDFAGCSMICCCSLAGTQACMRCGRWREYYGDWTAPIRYPIEPNVKPKRIIEKFDKDGKLMERIVEE